MFLLHFAAHCWTVILDTPLPDSKDSGVDVHRMAGAWVYRLRAVPPVNKVPQSQRPTRPSQAVTCVCSSKHGLIGLQRQAHSQFVPEYVAVKVLVLLDITPHSSPRLNRKVFLAEAVPPQSLF